MFRLRGPWFRRPLVRPVLVPRPRFYRRRIGCFPLWGMLLLLITVGGVLLFVLFRLR